MSLLEFFFSFSPPWRYVERERWRSRDFLAYLPAGEGSTEVGKRNERRKRRRGITMSPHGGGRLRSPRVTFEFLRDRGLSETGNIASRSSSVHVDPCRDFI